MASYFSLVVGSSTTTGINGVSPPQSNDAEGAVQRTGNSTPVRTKEVSTSQDLAQQSPNVQGEEVGEIVEQLNELAQQIERTLQFSVDEASGEMVITVVDSKTEEVIRQIPPKEILTLRQRLSELQGVLFNNLA